MFKIFFSLLLLFSIGIAAKIPVVIYCDDNYPPYSFSEKGKASGIYVNIFKKAFSQLEDYEVSIKPIPWKRGLKMLENGSGFAIFPPYYRPIKRPYLEYSLPILEEKVVIFLRQKIANQKHRTKWPEHFYGLRIGNNEGFLLGGKNFHEAVKQGKINLIEAKSNKANILNLCFGRIDGYINDKLSILYELKKIQEQKILDSKKIEKIVESVTISAEYGYLGYTKNQNYKFKEDFSNKTNQILTKMKKNKEIEKIVQAFLQKIN